MQHYADRLKAGIEVEKPIAIGVLKIKAKIGELLPAEKGGRGKPAQQICEFNRNTISVYRKLAANKEKIQEYADSVDDVPTQGEFIRWTTGAHVSKNSGEDVELLDAELIDIDGYEKFGKKPLTRVKALLTKLDSDYKHDTDHFGHKLAYAPCDSKDCSDRFERAIPLELIQLRH